jgi:site-specific recombinase XerC
MRGGAASSDALSFSTRNGTPPTQRNIRRGHFQLALKALDLIGIRFHDFRHFFVVLHVAARTHPKLVQARIGYNNINQPYDTVCTADGVFADDRTNQ